jgi:hypothetical protein
MQKLDNTKDIKSLAIFDKKVTSLLTLNESILLNQVLYWASKCGREIAGLEGTWIYNSLKDWHKQFPYWSLSTLRRTIKSLEDSGILISKKITAHKWNHTKWYSVNFNKLKKLTNNAIDKVNKSSSVIKFKSTQNSAYPTINKRANRFVQNEQIIITKNNYTNKSSYKQSKINLDNIPKKKIEEIKINPKEKEISNQMLYIWNKVFEYSVNPIKAYSNKKNDQTLVKLYKTLFKKDLDKWREYALLVNSSQFLMGEKKTRNNFKAVFLWLIKGDTIEKIQNGEYGVGDRELDMNNISKNIEEKKEEIINKMDKKISEYMKIKINDKKEREEFRKYVKDASITEDDSYGILKNIIKQVPKSYILEREEYNGMKENLYESYVMKKYLGSTKLDIRKKMRERTREIEEITDVKDKIRILRDIEEKIRTKDYIASNIQNNKEMENYSSGLLESILLTNPKKESRYLKGSSGESSMMDLVI